METVENDGEVVDLFDPMEVIEGDNPVQYLDSDSRPSPSQKPEATVITESGKSQTIDEPDSFKVSSSK